MVANLDGPLLERAKVLDAEAVEQRDARDVGHGLDGELVRDGVRHQAPHEPYALLRPRGEAVLAVLAASAGDDAERRERSPCSGRHGDDNALLGPSGGAGAGGGAGG